ncbi:MAG: hypothetical protein ACRDNS_33230, partial [Trebonia sp.]
AKPALTGVITASVVSGSRCAQFEWRLTLALNDDEVARQRRRRHAAPHHRRGPAGMRGPITWSVAAFVVNRETLVLMAWLVPLQPGQ